MNSKDNVTQIFEDCLAHSTPFVPSNEAGNDNNSEWKDPLPLKSERSPVKPFNLALLPDGLRPFVQDCSFRMQCPPDYIAVAAINMLSSLIGTACAVKPKKHDDWLVIPNLWGGIIGDPSTLKTPAINEAFAPLSEIEKEAFLQYQTELQEWERKEKISKLREENVKGEIRCKLKKENLTDEDACHLYAAQMKENPKPVCQRYKSNDATVEKVHDLHACNPRGLMVYRDELVGLLTGWNKQGHESDRAFYLESWNGNSSYTLDRIGRGTIHVDHLCLSIFGSMQPDKLLGYLQDSFDALENDGLLQRFQLLVYPDPLNTWEYIDQSPDQEAKDLFYQITKRIAAPDFFDNIADVQIVKEKSCFSFDDQAQEHFIQWLTDHEQKLKQVDESIILQHLAKYRKLMPALALIFHIIDMASGTQKTGKISEEATITAIEWCEYLALHARRIYGLASNMRTQSIHVLSTKIKQGALEDKFSLRDIYRKGWSLLKDKENAEAAVAELIRLNWIKEISTHPSLGGRIKKEYVIHPEIKKLKEEA